MSEATAPSIFLSNDWEAEPLPLAEVRRGFTQHFEKATIAHNLREVADPHVKAGSILSVVGNDLPNVSSEAYPWASKYLPEWLERGAEVRYFAIQPSAQALAKLFELTRRFGAKFQVRVLKVTAQGDPTASRLAAQWRTFHFAVFENAPQLWVEMNHPAGQTEALDCYYFAPDKAKDMPLFETCRRRFNWMFEEFGEIVG
jgi:hypothetical protein